MLHVDLLNTLHDTWDQLCAMFDVTADLPQMNSLFRDYDLHTRSSQIAELVMVNMLSELVEHIGRFSPWYKQPARSFGLMMVGPLQWRLTPVAVEEWCSLIESLSIAIERNTVLLQAITTVDALKEPEQSEKPYVIAQCKCNPPCSIRVDRAMLQKAQIVCAICEQAFHD